jgi:hypothetical protein
VPGSHFLGASKGPGYCSLGKALGVAFALDYPKVEVFKTSLDYRSVQADFVNQLLFQVWLEWCGSDEK